MILKCGKCKQNKESSCYTVDKGRSRGYNSYCKPCQCQSVRQYQKRNEDKIREKRKLNYPKANARIRAWSKNNPEKAKNKWLKFGYGITIDIYNALKETQDSKCAICFLSEEDHGKPLYVDHCHSKNKVRGLLCRECNLAIGFFKDNLKRIEQSIRYLERNNKMGLTYTKQIQNGRLYTSKMEMGSSFQGTVERILVGKYPNNPSLVVKIQGKEVIVNGSGNVVFLAREIATGKKAVGLNITVTRIADKVFNNRPTTNYEIIEGSNVDSATTSASLNTETEQTLTQKLEAIRAKRAPQNG